MYRRRLLSIATGKTGSRVIVRVYAIKSESCFHGTKAFVDSNSITLCTCKVNCNILMTHPSARHSSRFADPYGDLDRNNMLRDVMHTPIHRYDIVVRFDATELLDFHKPF